MRDTDINGAGRSVFTVREFTAGDGDGGKSCGDFLRGRGVSRRLTARAKRTENGITRNGSRIRTVDRIEAGDVVALRLEDGSGLVPNGDLRASAVYEDGDVVVFDKPAGMPVHPSAGHREDTLGNLFASMYPDIAFRAVNRLDKDTSGLCAAAKSAYAAGVLNGKVSKVYFAVTEGVPVPGNPGDPLVRWYMNDAGEYVIDAPLGRAEGSAVRREVRKDGKRAVTRYTILKENGKHCLVRVVLETGRTHQIRVHFSCLGYPLAGDDFYGGSLGVCKRQALHCGEMSFEKPSGGGTVRIFSPVREDMLGMFFQER